MTGDKLRILLVSAEVSPFVKVGGMADVISGLSKSLKAMGHDVRIAIPASGLDRSSSEFRCTKLLSNIPIPRRGGTTEYASVQQTFLPASMAHSAEGFAHAAVDIEAAIQTLTEDIPVYLIGNENAASPAPSPTDPNTLCVYPMGPEPYLFFCRAVLAMLAPLRWRPDIMHCNDWHTGMVPVLLKSESASAPGMNTIASLFTIHNLAFQGAFPRDTWPLTGLPDPLYRMEGLEFWGQWSFMKGALTFSDQVNTVSETYTEEIQTEEFGCGLQGLLYALSAEGRLSGIRNALDNEAFDPETDPHIAASFSAAHPEAKKRCKSALQSELALPNDDGAMIIGVISRLTDQKGIDLIQAIADQLFDLPVQLIALGAGDSTYEIFFKALQTNYPDQVRAHIGFDSCLARRIYAGCDIFLMPSRYEPCGTAQMIAMRYGAIPIARATGGLRETISACVPGVPDTGNGFLFSGDTGHALLQSIQSASDLYQDPSGWSALIQRALETRFSWDKAANQYVQLYAAAQSLPRSLPV